MLLKGKKMSENFERAVKKVDVKVSDSIIPQLKSVHWLVTQKIPLDKFNSLIQLQQENGAIITGAYKHHEQVNEMLTAMTDVCKESLRTKMEESPFIGIVLDESIDIAIYKKLILYVTVICNGEVKTLFGENIDVPNGKADTITSAVEEFLTMNNVAFQKLTGLGSDGAAVMTGRHNGVGVRLGRECPLLLHVHCCAHRLALAVSQASREVPALSKLEDTVGFVYRYYENSPVRYNNLRELEEVMLGDKVALIEPKSVRWLSLHEAVKAVEKCWPALVASLGEQAAGKNNPTAIGLSQKVETFSFVAYICLLNDILPSVTKLSKCFQDPALDYDKMMQMLKTTKTTLIAYKTERVLLTGFHTLMEIPKSPEGTINWHGVPVKKSDANELHVENTRQLFLNELLLNLERRFPEDDMAILLSLNNILNPQKIKNIADVANHGLRDLQAISEKFDGVAGFDAQRAKADFYLYKVHCRTSTAENLQEHGRDLLMRYSQEYPDFAVLMMYFLVVPLNSASGERGFSLQNLIKTKCRNRMTDITLNKLMTVSANGANFTNNDYSKAATKFRHMRNRKK
jgi:hypothetical protein